ncbi:cytochrome C [Anaeromyxobacter terrae]|uniref:cytochrome C n=1 Tax=Anaeromyxobacter terrae TaxID=2925406 RepID=UPI001F5A2703|nr:cytochrome C [Anaeromyxobacter sp. SG22]
MKFAKFAVAAVAALSFSSAYAFHDGGVATCDGCHTMHNSKGNKSMSRKGAGVQFQGEIYLLQGSDQSSTCLNCHAAADTSPKSYHIMTYPVPAAGTAPAEMSPGGDFAYLAKSYVTAIRGAPYTNAGDKHGHNVLAGDYGLVADSKLATAPGGNYDATKFSCISCHDPHSRARIVDAAGTIESSAFGAKTLPIGASGSYGALPIVGEEAVGVYRLLAPTGYVPMSVPTATAFVNNPPVAVAPSTYNRKESATDTRVAYGSGMSEWCANCHGAIHNNGVNSGNTKLIHPAGNGALLTAQANDLNGNPLGTTIANIYNAYKGSGDLTGTQATSYDSMIPFEEGATDVTALAAKAVIDGTQVGGPVTGTENVMCLSCHRAHATAFPQMSRWNNNAPFVAVDGQWPGKDITTNAEVANGEFNQGLTQAEYQAAMYDRPATRYAFFQRSLCNKCHAKD